MELWIRSQDKEDLIKVNKKVSIMDYGKDCFIPILIDDLQVAEYRTKERALEVLDEMQKLIQPPTNFIVSQHIDFDNNGEGLIGCNILKEEPKIEKISDDIVYEMPKE